MFDVGKKTIPLFIGTVLNWALFGALSVQVYLYFLAFPKDRLLNKIIVGFIFLAEISQTLGDSRNTIVTFGAGWGSPDSLDNVGWAWLSVPILGSAVASVGQIFFAWRISLIGDTLYIPALIVVITTFQCGAGIWTGVDIIRAGRFSLLSLHNLKPPVAWLAATATCDLIIVFATVAVSRIIRLSVETGVLCALFAIVDLSLYVAFDGNNYHLAACIWLSKVYSNSMMVILNSRAHFGHATPGGGTQLNTTSIVFRSRGSTQTAVHVSTETGRTDNSSHTRTTEDAEKDLGFTAHAV
ncbi:hypothetical protein MVEN_01855700 [Mycena venus]|uniref:DUF6534 domain-containing protein n=1 Tax=Mycena venus TaxID=2733690 RepID=A0A8H7CMY5_9AGAR|nr:hypothetical protein MVEN_01855700 [Mycena venus]